MEWRPMGEWRTEWRMELMKGSTIYGFGTDEGSCNRTTVGHMVGMFLELVRAARGGCRDSDIGYDWRIVDRSKWPKKLLTARSSSRVGPAAAKLIKVRRRSCCHYHAHAGKGNRCEYEYLLPMHSSWVDPSCHMPGTPSKHADYHHQ